MAVTVCLPLFGNPGRELEEASPPRPRDLRTLGQALHDRLDRAAELLEKFQSAGWSAQVGMFDIILTRAGVETREEAERLLREAAIDLDQVLVMEDVEEDEEPD